MSGAWPSKFERYLMVRLSHDIDSWFPELFSIRLLLEVGCYSNMIIWYLGENRRFFLENCCIDLECHFHFTLIFFPQRWEWCVWWQHLSWANSRSVSSGRICVNLLWPSLDSERRTHRGAGVLSRFCQQIYQEPCAIVQLKRWGEAYQP